jgi:anti-anti-sigma factor
MSEYLNPTTRDFTVAWSQVDGTWRMTLSGSLDAESAPELTQEFETSSASGRTEFDLDLRAIGMISSAGVGSLIAGVGEVRDGGGTVRVVAVSDPVQHVFGLLGLLDYLECPTSPV